MFIRPSLRTKSLEKATAQVNCKMQTIVGPIETQRERVSKHDSFLFVSPPFNSSEAMLAIMAVAPVSYLQNGFP